MEGSLAEGSLMEGFLGCYDLAIHATCLSYTHSEHLSFHLSIHLFIHLNTLFTNLPTTGPKS